MHVVTEKKVNFCVQYFVFLFIQILKFCKSLFYSCTLLVLFSFFISNLACCICANKIYISNRFIAICHTPLYCLIPIFPLKCCQNSQKIERTYLKAPDLLIFCYLEAVRASSSCFCVTKYMQFSKPVDKVGGEMSSIHIRHALPARIRTFFYNGVA